MGIWNEGECVQFIRTLKQYPEIKRFDKGILTKMYADEDGNDHMIVTLDKNGKQYDVTEYDIIWRLNLPPEQVKIKYIKVRK